MKKSKAAPVLNARNALRPFYNLRRPKPYWKQLQSIRQETPSSQFGEVCSVVEDNPNYPFQGFGNTFPRNKTQIPNGALRLLKPLSLNREASLQVARINRAADRIVQALTHIADVNAALWVADYDTAREKIDVLERDAGLSNIGLKKKLLVSLLSGGFGELSSLSKSLALGIDQSGWALMCRIMFDFVDPTDTPERAAPNWMVALQKHVETGGWFADPMRDDILGFSRAEADLANSFLRESGLSLVDLTLFLWRTFCVHGTEPIVKSIYGSLDSGIRDLLEAKFSAHPIVVQSPYRSPDGAITEEDLYRLPFLFSELSSAAIWKANLHLLMFPGELSLRTLEGDASRALILSVVEEVAANPKNLEAAANRLASWEFSALDLASDNQIGRLLKAALVAESLKSIAIDPDGRRGEDVAFLLTATQTAFFYVSDDVVQRLLSANYCSASELARFLAGELKFRKTRSPDNELDRRIQFMRLVQIDGDRSIVKLLDSVSKDNLQTAVFIAEICTRPFVERLVPLTFH